MAEKIAERWKEYCEELYEEKDVTTDWNFQMNEQESPPLKSEVKRTIKDIASQKTPGPDDVPTELIKNGGETVIISFVDKHFCRQNLVDEFWSTNFSRQFLVDNLFVE